MKPECHFAKICYLGSCQLGTKTAFTSCRPRRAYGAEVESDSRIGPLASLSGRMESNSERGPAATLLRTEPHEIPRRGVVGLTDDDSSGHRELAGAEGEASVLGDLAGGIVTSLHAWRVKYDTLYIYCNVRMNLVLPPSRTKRGSRFKAENLCPPPDLFQYDLQTGRQRSIYLLSYLLCFIFNARTMRPG